MADMTGQQLPPFSGHDSTCPKCGGRLDSRYYPAGSMSRVDSVIWVGTPSSPEWMLRVCEVCEYQYPEACRDAYPATAIEEAR